jgi:hypothetical protein
VGFGRGVAAIGTEKRQDAVAAVAAGVRAVIERINVASPKQRGKK